MGSSPTETVWREEGHPVKIVPVGAPKSGVSRCKTASSSIPAGAISPQYFFLRYTPQLHSYHQAHAYVFDCRFARLSDFMLYL